MHRRAERAETFVDDPVALVDFGDQLFKGAAVGIDILTNAGKYLRSFLVTYAAFGLIQRCLQFGHEILVVALALFLVVDHVLFDLQPYFKHVLLKFRHQGRIVGPAVILANAG